MTAAGAPRVSVLMAVHNGARHIRESIESLLAQSFTDFELVVVDDASTDGTRQILAGIGDPRLRVIHAERNLGAAGARNLGFSLCRGEYLAILDHDDLCRPERLAVQVAFLDRHPGIVLVGSEIRILENGRLRQTDHAPGSTPLLLRWMLHVDNPLTFSSVMLRADAIRTLGVFLRPGLSEDFDLYHRLLPLGGVARLDEVLTIYRAHAGSVSLTEPEGMLRGAAQVLAPAIAPWLGEDAEAAARLIIRHLSERRPVTEAADLDRLGAVLERMLEGFCAAHAPDPADRLQIEAHASRVWWRVIRAGLRSGHPAFLRRLGSRPALRQGFRPSPGDILASLAIGLARRGRVAVARGAFRRRD
ncbi:glycosyltransferase family 2 protein [Roseomonas marmotae]|uniref:Glycosyltransferase family 2 protein n=1 Tax=Roseomonas marmotae TaxID=2768161 RepID=A0ABS3K738_9PROT|nr:glycosyltransferase family 2 protein [Roseomonas marmotae]MBO1073271.1 glycosyltransferase family 2 protein [Roseomonas marmotae]QTI79109.1 glycosyltransferase family 2 protein [Roseomonas marmotae]